jgi:hypothetical protein
MKNIIALIVCLGLTVISCKKNRVCNCTVTTIGTTKTTTSSELFPVDTTIITPLYTNNTNKATYKEVTKRQAKNNCFDRSEDINETSTNNIPGFVNITNQDTGTRTYDCKLE